MHVGKRHGSAVRLDEGGAGFLFLFVALWTRRLRKNYLGTRELRWSARVAQQENAPADAQKGRLARPQRVKGREVQTALRVGRSPLPWVLANGKTPPVIPISERLSSVRGGSERCENAAGGLFKHPARATNTRACLVWRAAPTGKSRS